MNADDIAPDLYEKWDLDRSGGEDELSVLLEAKDIKLGQQGYNPDEPRRVQLRIAASILGSAIKRTEYDQALRTGLRPTWGELGTLSSVGQWSLAARPQGLGQAAGFVVPNQEQERPTQDTRIGLGIVDLFLAGGISTACGGGVDELVNSGTLSYVVGCIAMVIYVLGSEVWMGASPAKILAGYTVRDVDSKEKLSLSQSAKRQWWRLINIIPGIGHLVGMVAVVVLTTTINEENHRRGSHDELANAEVVKRRPRK